MLGVVAAAGGVAVVASTRTSRRKFESECVSTCRCQSVLVSLSFLMAELLVVVTCVAVVTTFPNLNGQDHSTMRLSLAAAALFCLSCTVISDPVNSFAMRGVTGTGSRAWSRLAARTRVLSATQARLPTLTTALSALGQQQLQNGRLTVPFTNHHLFTAIRGGMSTATSTALNSAVAEATEKASPVEYFRKDYKPLPFVVSKINMDFDIFDGKTTVTSELSLVPNKAVSLSGDEDLELNGDETCVKLLSIKMDGTDLEAGKDYVLAPGKLILKPSALKATGGVLETVVEIVPEDNTQLSGLYKSGPVYCSQCEAMGFRRITYYPDRPDVMAVFDRVRVAADAKSFPVLLSNGNLLEEGKTDDGRHFAVWSDPFPKPSYLFCVVAGDLDYVRDSFMTMSGREIQLGIYSEKENVGKLGYAMESLKRAMKWDEDTFGLEYDLDLYNVVAVNDFNMGGE